ncbi:MAG TPA: CPBP family intramembrane metalloprotease [Spirochaetes bacterium]|nr:CPBP family intramembrane metalloprotease [Spirochaetota bacterium]
MVSYFMMRYGVGRDVFVLVNNIIYNFFVILAVGAGLVLVYRKLIEIGYPRDKVRRFFAIIALFILPAGYISSRAANIFYYPASLRTIDLLYELVSSESYHTFHASIMLPTVLITALLLLMKFRFSDVADAFFLYMPLSHAIGRVACFLVGCCWGRYIEWNMFGHGFGFHNPVPLYEIAYNTIIFLTLRKLHRRLYAPGAAPDTVLERGKVMALYLILYGDARFITEFFRTEQIVRWGLTQAQLVMALFVLAGSLVLFSIWLRKRLAALEDADRLAVTRRYTTAGFTAYFFFCFGAAAWLLYYGHVLWPLAPVDSLHDAYGRLLTYLPVFMLEVAALWFLRVSKIPLKPAFGMDPAKLRTPVVYIGVLGSAAYGALLYVLTDYGIRGPAYWPPVFIFSVMNAFSEEVFFRLVFYNLLRKAGMGALAANLAQAALYSTVHLAVGGPLFALYSFVYGLVMGEIYRKTESIIPAMVCHFIIDLGVIGFPLLHHCASCP